MTKKSLPFIAKLKGRLTLLEHTQIQTPELSLNLIASQYGNKLSTFIESGNDDAIQLLGLLEDRTKLLSNRNINIRLVESLTDRISVLSEKLDIDTTQDQEIVAMLGMTVSPGRFESQRHFKTHLCEGLIINVNKLASKALAIPYGEYLVSTSNTKSTMLVPTNEDERKSGEVLANQSPSYELHTLNLLKCWNKIERVIGERRKFKTDTSGEGGGYRVPRGKPEAKSGRPSLKAAVDDAGGVSAAAEKTGLSVPAISNDINNNSTISYWAQEKYMAGLDVDPRVFHQFGEVIPYKFAQDTTDTTDEKEEKKKEPARPKHNQETVSQK